MLYLLKSRTQLREDHENLFNNPRYQDKLTAHGGDSQEEAEGYNEVWD